jgi:adenylate cyclase
VRIPGGSTSQVPSSKRSKRSLKHVAIAAAVAIGVGAAIALSLNFRTATRGGLQAPEVVAINDKSIAVLPFVDMSEKKDQEYFSDGLSEELIDMLTKVPDLRVPARTSSFYFKGKQTTIGDIGKVLDVTYVLEGSVRKSGNTLRITAQLIRVDNGYHVWSKSFDRPLGDIFQIQDDISNAVVSALKVSLGASSSIPSDETSNSTAYDLFLRADSAYRLSNKKEDYQEIVEELQEAIRIDPRFARAWALLSRTLSTMAGYSFIEPTKGFEDARHAALTALELNPNEIAGHLALAKVLYLHDWNWERANGETQKALAIKPNDPENLGMAGVLASILGHADEALQYSKRASDIDPLNFSNFDILGEYF